MAKTVWQKKTGPLEGTVPDLIEQMQIRCVNDTMRALLIIFK
jgi:hypothetical protein